MKPEVTAAQVFGSCAFGSCKWRSDLNVLIVGLEGHRRDIRREVAALADTIMKEYAVPLSVQLVCTDQFTNGLDMLPRPFVKHIHRVASLEDVRIKGDVPALVPLYQLRQEDVLVQAKEAFKSIEAALMRADRLHDSQLPRLLQKVAEAPVHVARAQLDLMGELGTDDQSQTVFEQYVASMLLPTKLVQAFSIAHEVNHVYDQQLLAHMWSSSNETYVRMLHQLQKWYAPVTLAYLESVMRHLARS